jgi:tetratricopeptide (TPR) repeat protein
MYIALAILAVVGLLGLLYYAYAPGPVRGRVLARARAKLKARDWQSALDLVGPFLALPSAAWQKPFRHLAGECHQHGVEHTLREHDYEAAREHAVQVAQLLGQNEQEQVQRVVDAALAEARRRFATGNDLVEPLLGRIEALQSPPPAEILFWRALLQVREGHLEAAIPLLAQASEKTGREVLDPPLYMGFVLHRLGHPAEALKWLSEANRIDANCPLVPWQIGVTLMASGGDSGVALRVLQKAMSARGLPQWQREPGKLWIEGLPEGRSFIRRLALKNGDPRGVTFPCPLLGTDLNVLVRQGNLALAQACFRQERFSEAADLYGQLLQNAPPTPVLLRGYGVALARSGQHDAAFKQLRLAFDQEDPKDPFTAGYMALCAAMGKPTKEGDKARNVTWALKLLAKYPVLENVEWANLLREVHLEARKNEVVVAQEDQELVCDALASVQAHDPKSATLFVHLAQTHPQAIKPIYAWLYTQAATVHGVTSGVDLELFARTFLQRDKASGFFAQQKWDLAATEFVYLQRAADRSPGRFPEALGSDYSAQGTAVLLARSHTEEKAGRVEPARQAMEVLLKLSPDYLPAYDRLACLHYRAGDAARAVHLLARWRSLAPRDHWPLVRQAVIEQERGETARRSEAIQQALGLTQGRLRAGIAYLGATLALREAIKQMGTPRGGHLPDLTDEHQSALQVVGRLLDDCLSHDPSHAAALTCLAALRSVHRDTAGLAALADRLPVSPDVPPVTRYMAAVCHWAAGQYDRAKTLALEAAGAREWQSEARLIAAWSMAKQGAIAEALPLLEGVTRDETAASRQLAHALAGHLHEQQQQYEETIRHWSAIDAATRTRWGLEEPLRLMVFLGGLMALDAGRYEQAAERFREAGKLGLRERRLGGLITLALVKAGQKLLYETAGA